MLIIYALHLQNTIFLLKLKSMSVIYRSIFHNP